MAPSLEFRLERFVGHVLQERAALLAENALLKEALAEGNDDDPTLQEAATTAREGAGTATAAADALSAQVDCIHTILDVADEELRLQALLDVAEEALGLDDVAADAPELAPA